MLNEVPRSNRILIVDDQPANVRLLEKLLATAGFSHFKGITDSGRAISTFIEFEPDLVILDLRMPGLNGFDLLRQFQVRIPKQTYLPIAILTAEMSQSARQKALSLGAKDFITKPFDNTEVVLRIRTLLETRRLHRELEHHNHVLEQKVCERTKYLEQAQLEILERLALAAEYRDDATGRHTYRVGQLSAVLAHALGFNEQRVEVIRHAAPLHDLGKIGIPDSILLKPGKLTPEEYEIIKGHTTIGAHMLSGSVFPILQTAERIALYHHEHWNGKGYWGKKGEEIPIEARIVAIADTFDVLIHSRPYKEAWTVNDAVKEIKAHSGRQFDPELVSVFLQIVDSDALGALVDAVRSEIESRPLNEWSDIRSPRHAYLSTGPLEPAFTAGPAGNSD